jgi:hypothetical protein
MLELLYYEEKTMQKTKPDLETKDSDSVDGNSDTLDTGAMLVEFARSWRDSKPSPEQCIWPIEGLLFS